jgi:hypothetical protein
MPPAELGYRPAPWSVVKTLANRITAIPDALFRITGAGPGFSVSRGHHLNGPLGLVVAPDGDILGGYRVTPIRTGSGASDTPNASRTPSLISRASASSAAVLADPALTRASVCLAEIRAPSPGL